MKKKIEDYLHFYPKVDIAICEPGVEPISHHLEGFDWDNEQKPVIAERTDYPYSWIKPILRPLSDITDEEFKEVVILNYSESRDVIEPFVFRVKRISALKQNTKYGTSIPYSCFNTKDIHTITGTFSSMDMNPEQFLYLLKQRFDLFNLIENGLAIDKTKL